MDARLTVGFCASLALSACVSRPATSVDAAAPTPADAAAPTHEWKVLEKLGAKIEVPVGCNVDDTSSEGRPPAYSVYDAVGVFSVTLREPRPGEAVELEAARPAARITREEKGPDGSWLVQWEMERPGETSRTDFGVEAVRRVAGRSVRCSRTLGSAQAAAAVARACLSIGAK